MSLCRRSVRPAPAASNACGSPGTGLQVPGRAAVVEHRLAEQLDLDRAVEALDRAHEHVVGVVVGRRARVRGRRARLALAPRADRSARRARPPSRSRSARSSRARWCPARSGGRPARPSRTARAGSRRRRGRGSPRTRSASQSAAGTATRRCRRGRPARPCGSRRGRRSRRSAGTARCRATRSSNGVAVGLRAIPRVHRAGAAQARRALESPGSAARLRVSRDVGICPDTMHTPQGARHHAAPFPSATSRRRRGAQPPSAITCATALISARCVKACGKLPRWRPLRASSSSA